MRHVYRPLVLAAMAAALAASQHNRAAVSSVHAQAAQCGNITKLDLKNTTIRINRRTFAFHDGVAANYDDGAGERKASSPPDWKAVIEKDVVLQPAADVVVRFLLIHDVHATGSGWRYYAVAFRCAGGQLLEVFHQEGMSLSIDRLSASVIRVGLSSSPGAPRKIWSYIWDPTKSRYVLSRTRPNSPR